MKKFLMFLIILMTSTVVLMAQTDVPVPADLNEVFVKFQFWVSAFAPLVGLTVFFTQLLLKVFRVTTGGLKQVISWGTGVVLVVALNLLHLGIAKDLIWYGVIAYSIAVALGANRAFDVGLLESILKFFKLYKPNV